MNPSIISSPFPSLDICIGHFKSSETERSIEELFQSFSIELREIEGERSALSTDLLEQLCSRWHEVIDLYRMSEKSSRLSEKMKVEGGPIVMRLIDLLHPFPRLTDCRTHYLLFAIELERQLGAQEETILTYYLHILFSSPNKRFDPKSAASFCAFYDEFVRQQLPQFVQLLQHSIKKDEQVDKARLPHVVSALDRINQLEQWRVDPKVLITYYQKAKQALSSLSSREGWNGIASIRTRIHTHIERLNQAERREGLTALEFQHEALAQYHAHFRDSVEKSDPQTPTEVRTLQEQLFALFCTFFHDHLLRGPFMLLQPPFPEVDGEPACAIRLLGSASRQELSPHSDFEAFFLIQRERGAWDNCLEQIDRRLHDLRTYRKELRQFLESSLRCSQERKYPLDLFLDQLKHDFTERFQEATEPQQKLFLKSLIGQLPKKNDRNALIALLEGALERLNSADGSDINAFNREAIIPTTPQMQKVWNLKQKIFHSSPTGAEEEMTPTERIESRILIFLQGIIRDSFTGCSLQALSQQREAIAQAVEELAILFQIQLGSPTATIDQFSKKGLLREQETEKISFLFTQPMKGADFAYMEQWLQRLKVAFLLWGSQRLPKGLNRSNSPIT